jgi:inosine-uridine nucleoside N-ribohydrolase
MKAKLKKQSQKELIKKHELENPPPYTEGYWEDAMLENDSYWDIGVIENYNKPINAKIKYWENYQAQNWLGKWWRQSQIDKLKKQLKHYQ